MGEVLYKILEELEHEILTNKEIGRKQCEGIARAMNIIRSHMKKRRKVSSAEIVERNIDGKPYYEIKYKEIGTDEFDIGYGSYCLDYVVKWLNECFEFCNEVKTITNNKLMKILKEIDSLHNKILKDKFAEKVTEQEIDSLVKAKEIIHSNMSEVENDERLIKKYVTNRQVVRDFNNKPLYIKGCCPKCGCELKSCETDYCRACGQALVWENSGGGL